MRELRLGAPIVVATDHDRVADAVEPLGVEVVLTPATCRSGTERVATVAALPPFRRFPVILNVQGDEPFVAQEAVRGALERVQMGDPIGTAGTPLDAGALLDRNRVKVMVSGRGRALRFTRMLAAGDLRGPGVEVLQHVGVYAYTRAALMRWVSLPAVTEEIAQGLEQLRPLAHGIPIGVARVRGPAVPGVDTEEDLARAEAYLMRYTEGAVR